MYEATVKKLDGTVTHGPSKYKTLDEANTWKEKHEAKENPWTHKKDRWLREANFDDETIETSSDSRAIILEEAIAEREVPILGEEGVDTGEVETIPAVEAVTVTEYKFDQEYTVDIVPYETPYQELRQKEYNKEGCTTDAMIVALWESEVEGRPEALNALQSKRQGVKAKHPKT